MPSLKYSNVLLKISGEALMGEQPFGMDPQVVSQVCADIKEGIDLGARVGMVVGGGNLFRGVSLAAEGADRVTGDHMGMLATVMNALALKMEFERQNVPVAVLSAIPMPTICEPFSQRAAARHRAEGRAVIYAGGTGNPFFTTDTAAALRACEAGSDALFKATMVDGIYSADPKKIADATRYDELSHDEMLAQGLEVMDAAAVSLCRNADIPIVVYSILEPGGFAKILQGSGRSTTVRDS